MRTAVAWLVAQYAWMTHEPVGLLQGDAYAAAIWQGVWDMATCPHVGLQGPVWVAGTALPVQQ